MKYIERKNKFITSDQNIPVMMKESVHNGKLRTGYNILLFKTSQSNKILFY